LILQTYHRSSMIVARGKIIIVLVVLSLFPTDVNELTKVH